LVYALVLASLFAPGKYLQGEFFAYRSEEYGSGVCPSLPLLFLFTSFLVWSFVHLQRMIFTDERYERLPALRGGENDPIKKWAKELDQSLKAPLPGPRLLGVGIPSLVLVIVGLAGLSNIRSLEGVLYDGVLIALTGTLAALLALGTARFCLSWRILLHVLELLEQHPIREAFDLLPPDHSWSPIWQQSPRKRSYVALSRAIDCVRNLRQIGAEGPEDGQAPGNLEYLATGLLDTVSKGEQVPASLRNAVQESLRDISQNMIDDLERQYWSQGASQSLNRMATEENTKDALKATKQDIDDKKIYLFAQEFVAMRFVAYIRYAMLQLRNLLTFIVFGLVLLTLSLGSYPFQSPQTIGLFLGVAFIGIGGPIIWAFVEMARDATLSRITHTKAGSLDWEFYLRTASFVVLPVLTLLASHFPSVGQYVSSWIQPALKALH
jgi:hypothetical protein